MSNLSAVRRRWTKEVSDLRSANYKNETAARGYKEKWEAEVASRKGYQKRLDDIEDRHLAEIENMRTLHAQDLQSAKAEAEASFRASERYQKDIFEVMDQVYRRGVRHVLDLHPDVQINPSEYHPMKGLVPEAQWRAENFDVLAALKDPPLPVEEDSEEEEEEEEGSWDRVYEQEVPLTPGGGYFDRCDDGHASPPAGP